MSVQPSAAKKVLDLSRVHMVIIILFMFAFGYLPPIGTITPVGMKILGIFIGLLYGWSTFGMLWPSLLGMFALGFSGMGSVKEMLSMGFSNEIVIFLIFVLVLIEMLSDCDAVNTVVNFFLTRKSLQGRPWLFSFVFLLASGLLCTFGQAFAAFFLCWSILELLFKRVNYKPYDTYPTIMIIGVVISAAAIGLMVPFKATPLLILGAYAGLTGISVNYLQYMLVMIPAGLLFLAGYLFFCHLLLKPDMAPMQNIDASTLVDRSIKATKRQKASLLGFGFFLLLLLIPGCLPTSWPFVIWMNRIGIAGITVFCTIVFTLIHIDGKPLLDFPSLARRGLNWPITFMVAVLMMMTSLLMNEATGIKAFVLLLLQPITAHCTGFTFLLALFILGVILTNFMNNMVVAFMMVPVLVAVSDSMALNTTVGVLLILIATSAAYLTPAASPATAMLFAKKEWLRSGDIIKIGCISIAVITVVGLTVVFGLGNLVF